MAEPPKAASARRFATVYLPWLIGLGALLAYGLTLNRWISLHNLPVVLRVYNWDWQPQLQRPLLFLATSPFRLLPQYWVPPALNFFTAICAALVLLLLARSVALWPQDRTRPQWWREENEFGILSISTAWLPPLVAVMACGLQLTFWENATTASGEMLDLLIFALCIHALLQFRITQKQIWLSGAALAYAAGMADNWTFIAYLPAFLAAIIWTKGFGVFEIPFLARMIGWGACGLCVYLCLPLIHQLSSANHVDFWPALKSNLRAQKYALTHFPGGTWAALGFTVGIPVLAMSVCWRGANPNFGDDSLVGSVLTKTIFHFVHAVFLLFSLWLILDSPFSPRKIGYGLPWLTQYYLSALVIGYCFGYFLLIGTIDVPKYVSIPVYALLGALVCAVPISLLWRNLDQIRATNGPLLRNFARQLYESLPPGKSVVLSDDAVLLAFVRAESAGRGDTKEPLFLDARAMIFSAYQRSLAREYKSRWPFAAPTNGMEVIEPSEALNRISKLEGRAVYLQPSFSYYLERFQERPHESVTYLSPRTGGVAAKLDANEFSANDKYWQAQWTNFLHALVTSASMMQKPSAGMPQTFAKWLRLTPEPNQTESFISAAVSKALDYWGVCAQRAGYWDEAGVSFQRAIELKPENLSARINLVFNERHRRGDSQPLDREAVQNDFLPLFTRYRTWESAINDNGPVDEPTFLFESARALFARGTGRQAAVEFARCAELAPEWPEPRLWLAQTLLEDRDFEGALHTTEEVQSAGLRSDGSGLAQLLFCRAMALQGLNRTNESLRCVSDFVTRHPEQEEVLSIAARLYLQRMDYAPALGVLEQLLHHEPGNLEYLANKGLAEIQLSEYDRAIATLNSALALSPSNGVVRLNRAIASVRAGRLDAARADYEVLLDASPNSSKVLFGLGEIAWRKHDTNACIRFYEQCLTNNLPDPADRRLIARRLKELQGTK